MLSGELASRAAKLKREQQERMQQRQQREQADRDALRRQEERLRAAEEEGRRRRLAELARQDELRLQASTCDTHVVPVRHPACVPFWRFHWSLRGISHTSSVLRDVV
jgi:hypothetical protein